MICAEAIGDALILTMTRGVSLADWERLGMLSREWALYDRLSPHYQTIVLVTYGGGGDREMAGRLSPKVRVVCNDHATSPEEFEAGAPDRVLDLVADARQAVVKTNQMEGGTLAIGIARRLRAAGVRTGLIARGGYLWSRFVAAEHGAATPLARRVAEQEGALCRAADVVVGTSEQMVGDLEWRYGLPRDSVALIPNYVADLPQRGAEGREPLRVLYAGQLVTRKRVDILMQAISQMPEPRRSEVTLHIVGEGPEEANLRKLAAELRINVEFDKRMPHAELAERMSRCAVYAQASALEGHPKTVIEAMATGAPVVVADAPGLGDVVDHCQTGLCTPPNADAFAWAINGLLDDREWREALGTAAANRARLKWGLDTIFMLELDAHRQAARRSGNGRAAPDSAPGEVRWEPPLLAAGLQAQVAAWERSISGFTGRLQPRRRAEFLMALDTPFYHMQGRAAVDACAGLHPKHRLMAYHDFFVERIGPGDRVIDLGSGVGALAASIAERSGAHVTGQDWSQANLAKARADAESRGLTPRLSFVPGDITADRVPGSFDVVVLSNVLEHITDRPARLRLWRRWYGAARFLVRVPAFDREWRTPWKKELGVEWRLDDTHQTEYTLPQLTAELQEAGLEPGRVITRWGEYWVEATAR
ncbi:MAG: glycosyltransferase [Phycisphaerales bacterium]|nr:glycosyltransferase [Phycisphaerales bacterium]